MLIPLSWLKEYVTIKIPFPQLAAKLSSAGLTVETWQEKDGEIIFDPEVTPNRSDWLSVTGIAREVAAITGVKLNLPEPKIAFPQKIKNPLEITIKDNPNLCPRVTTVIIRNVQVKQSPEFIKKKILKIGLRPINNLVDITNLVLWEFGNPLHVFDYDKIRGKTMITELSKGGEDFKSLDGISYHLPKDAIVIKDIGRVIDLPPIKGGENTAVSNSTKNVLLHSIVCDPVLTRKASQALNLRSDSEAISERGVDPNGTVRTVLRALELILELAGGEVASNLIDYKKEEFLPWEVRLDHVHLEKVLGIKIAPKQVTDTFHHLGLATMTPNSSQSLTYTVQVPTFRPDLKIEEDLIEEIGRLIGYDNFPKTLPAAPTPTGSVAYARDFNFEYNVKQILKGAGYSEIYTYSLISENQLVKLGLNPEKVLRVDNPISKEFEYLRPALIGNLLDAYKLNQANFPEIKLFELGKEYKGGNLDKSKEEYWIWGIESGENFYQAKNLIELQLNPFSISYNLRPVEPSDHFNWCHPGRTALLFTQDKKYLGFVGEAHPSLLAKWGIKGRATIWELNYELLEKLANPNRKYEPIPKYPPVIEDLTLEIPLKILYADILSVIKKSSHFVSSVALLGEHQNNKTLRITYQSLNRNLSDKEVGQERDKIIKNLKKGLKVQIKE